MVCRVTYCTLGVILILCVLRENSEKNIDSCYNRDMANSKSQFTSVVSHFTKAKAFGFKIEDKSTERNYRELVHPDDKRVRIVIDNFHQIVHIQCVIGRGGSSVLSTVNLNVDDDKNVAYDKVHRAMKRTIARFRKNQEALNKALDSI